MINEMSMLLRDEQINVEPEWRKNSTMIGILQSFINF